MPLKAKFKDTIRLSTKNSAVLMTVISLGNHLQMGSSWVHFVELVNQCYEGKSLEKLIIVTTGHLQGHYFSLGLDELLTESEIENKAQALDKKWLEKQAVLDKLKIPVEIISWKDLLNKSSLDDLPIFAQFFQTIKSDFNTNAEFRNLVNEHAAAYVAKKIASYIKGNHSLSYDAFLKVSVDYILEECAAVLQLFKCGADFLSYPGGMNPPARHVWSRYFQDAPLKYVRYEIKNPQAKQTLFRQNNLIADYAHWALNRVNWNPRQQFQFMQGLGRLFCSVNYNHIEEESSQALRSIAYRRSM